MSRLLILAALASCTDQARSPANTNTNVTTRASSPITRQDWWRTVSNRIQDGSHAFRPEGTGWRAEIAERGLRGQFSAGNAWIGTRDGGVRLQTLAVGRTDALLDPLLDPPRLGDCVGEAVDPSGRCVRQIAAAGDGLTEWWESDARGFEQGWTIDRAPDGTGPLTVAIGLRGAMVQVSGRDASLLLDDGEELEISGLEAWDARGEPLAARIVPSEAGFSVTVEDAGASYPVEIDPIYASADWTLIGTADSAPEFGYSVAAAGDTNGDGYPDLVVGAYGYQGVGAAFIYEGSASGLETDASLTLSGTTDYEQFGETVAGIGDVDGDGYDDVAVAAPGDSISSGRVDVFMGSSKGTGSVREDSYTGSRYFGYGLANAVDVNGDGYDDLVVGAPSATTYGYVYVYSGSATGLPSSASTTITAPYKDTEFGHAIANAGDTNGDGYDDVVVGANQASSYKGQATVYLGSASGLTTTGAVTVTGAAGAYLGTSVSGGGDVNGDGYDDVVVGAPEESAAYVFEGSASGISSSPSTSLLGTTSSSNFGISVTLAGDLNGDGYDDVSVSENGGGSSDIKAAYVYLGSRRGVSDTAAVTLDGDSVSHFGSGLAGAGDINQDGYDDLAVGSYSDGAGKVDLYYGSDAVLDSSAPTELDGPSVGTGVGSHVAGAGDVNGDGYSDLLVSAAGADEVYLYEGSSAGLSETASTTLSGTADSNFGHAISGAGDVNGDGYDDVIVGSYNSSATTNEMDIYLGGSSGLASTASTTVTSTTREYGYCVAGAGDVDGDGYDDVLVSAPYYGLVYVYKGSASGVSKTAAKTLSGGTGMEFGNSIAGAGDVNGDGYDDIVVGMPYNSSTSYPYAYVYYGSSAGITTSGASSLKGSYYQYGFGHSVAAAGDVNGDGYADIIIGEYTYNTYYGRAYVYDGSASGIATSATTTLTGSTTKSAYFGSSVAGAGDIDGDGYDDVIVGAYNETDAAGDTGAGKVYVYPGGPIRVSSTAENTLGGTSEYQYFGADVAGVGDVDGDGYDDVAVGTSGSGFVRGEVEVFRGYADDDDDGVPSTADCDDEDPTVTTNSWYVDSDGDGYGDPDNEEDGCTAPSGTVADDTDCDDSSATAHPGGSEICDDAGVDEDCDGLVNDDDPSMTGSRTWYTDADGDGYGVSTSTISACDLPTGGSALSTDCDDTRADVSPGSTEVCDAANTDEDCDGLSDDDDPSVAHTGYSAWYSDGDGDGYGDVSDATMACDAPTGRVADDTDCDDTDAAINPAASEVCDDAGVDEDCDGLVNDDDPSVSGGTSWYTDSDGDGYGDPASTAVACEAPSGMVADSSDCDDGNASISPAATEICDPDNVDEDCDGLADDADDSVNPAGYSTYSADADGDGYGDPSATVLACDPTAGASADSTDCDDANAAAHPGGTEVCDGAGGDEDCDGLVDDADPSVTGLNTWYLDADSDGYGDPLTTATSCAAPAGYVADGTDCNDGRADVSPGAVEVCDSHNLDEDCDGLRDDEDDSVDPSTETTWYADLDGDGYGNPDRSRDACDAPNEFVVNDQDCDDTDENINPAAEDIPGDGIDQDCDGSDAGAVDTDTGGADTDTGSGSDTSGSQDTSGGDQGGGGGAGKKTGCGCASTGPSSGLLPLLLVGLALRRRRSCPAT